MTKNVGHVDKIIRIVLGLLLIALTVIGTLGEWGWIAALVGVILIGTGLMSACPAYKLLGIHTCPVEHKSQG